MPTSGSFHLPPSGGGSGTDDQQLDLTGDELILEDGGPPIDISDFKNEEIFDAFGNPI